MRILLIHNRYQSHAPSGEDIVFADECQLLSEHGHEAIIKLFVTSNKHDK